MIAPIAHSLLDKLHEVLLTPEDSAAAPKLDAVPAGPLHIGVDLGTAYFVTIVLDENCEPLAGEYQYAEVARDGLVVDFFGAVEILKGMKRRIEARIGRELAHAATAYPPGIPQGEVRALGNVIEAAGMRCSGLVDEPTAANSVLAVQNGAIVDVGGGTTGVAIVRNGKVIHTADEATGGTQFTLVVAGNLDIPFEQAEARKIDPAQQESLFPALRAVMEKVGSIILRHTAAYDVEHLYLVGGTSSFPGMAQVITEYTGIPATVPAHPMFVTPLGIAMNGNGV